MKTLTLDAALPGKIDGRETVAIEKNGRTIGRYTPEPNSENDADPECPYSIEELRQMSLEPHGGRT